MALLQLVPLEGFVTAWSSYVFSCTGCPAPLSIQNHYVFIFTAIPFCGETLHWVWLGWSFLYRNPYSAVLLAGDQNSVGNTPMFCCFRYYWTVLAQHQCLFSLTFWPQSELVGSAQEEGDTAGTSDPNCPKEYSMPYNIMLSNKT